MIKRNLSDGVDGVIKGRCWGLNGGDVLGCGWERWGWIMYCMGWVGDWGKREGE